MPSLKDCPSAKELINQYGAHGEHGRWGFNKEMLAFSQLTPEAKTFAGRMGWGKSVADCIFDRAIVIYQQVYG